VDKKKVREVLALYRQKFVELDIEAEDFPHLESLPSDFLIPSLSHCHGMLGKMEALAEEGRMEKCFRWLGFIQGVLWAARVYSLEELKNHSRPTE
jgi:hypothetical protein